MAGTEDWDLINAGKTAVTPKPGTSVFDHADSFAMVRGRHPDVTILGACEVAKTGDLANWSTGPKGVPAVGDAVDLVQGAKRPAVITDPVSKDGKPKVPQAGMGCVTRIYASPAEIDIKGGASCCTRNCLRCRWRNCRR